MTFLDFLYNKTKGAIWGLSFSIVGVLGLVLALVLTMISSDYMFHKNFVSDLSMGPNGANIVFIIWMVLMGITGTIFTLYYTKFIIEIRQANRKLAFTSMSILIVYGLVLIAITAFPLDYSNILIRDIHLALGVALFFTGGLGLIIMSVTELKAKNVPILLPIIGFLAGVPMIIFSIILFLGSFTSVMGYSTTSYILEWIAFMLLFGWYLIHTLYLINTEILKPRKAQKEVEAN